MLKFHYLYSICPAIVKYLLKHVTTKIIFVIIYLLEDEQELSLGMLIRPKRIYNFCLFRAYFMTLLHAFIILLYHFKAFYWTSLLMVARVHKFLFLHFMCRNYLDKGKITKEALWELDSNFPEICPHQTVFRDHLGNARR